MKVSLSIIKSLIDFELPLVDVGAGVPEFLSSTQGSIRPISKVRFLRQF